MNIYISRKANIKFNIKAHYEQVVKFFIVIIILLLAAALALSVAAIMLDLQFERYTIEAGDCLTAIELAGEGAYFGDDFDPDCLNHSGAYYFTVHKGNERITIRLAVKDTKAPEITVKKVYYAVNGKFPTPEDFIDTVVEADAFTGEFLTEMPETKSFQTHKMKIRFTDASGNRTKIFDVEMTEIYDSTPPKLFIDEVITVPLGQAVEYAPHITMSDNCIGELSYEVDEKSLKIDELGEYTVYVTAVDAVGNKSERVAVLVNVVEEYSPELLSELVEDISSDIADKDDDSPEEICREIYSYLQKNISYSGASDKSDYKRAAYYAFVGGEGDCFSYFSAAKVLFEYFGIENLDIERSRGAASDTHFWSLVNIGDESGERWYHFDATLLRKDKYDHSGCLLTDKQLEAYNLVRENFYLYDKAKYPRTEMEIITSTPSLEEFY